MHIKEAIYEYQTKVDKAVKIRNMLYSVQIAFPDLKILHEVKDLLPFGAYCDVTIQYSIENTFQFQNIIKPFIEQLEPLYLCNNTHIVPTKDHASNVALNMVDTGLNMLEINPIKGEGQFVCWYVKLNGYLVKFMCELKNHADFQSLFTKDIRYNSGHIHYYNLLES